MHDPLDPRDLLLDELAQRRESGYLVEDDGAVDGADDETLRARLAALERAPRDPAWPYVEPSAWADIQAARPPAPPRAPLRSEALRERVRGAWLGRCAGCALGKPVENWPRVEIRRYLERTGDYPIADYLPADRPDPAGLPLLHPSWEASTRGRIREMPRDDDIDYTVLGLHLLETHGTALTTAHVAEAWLARFPFTAVYTAERAAYRNLVQGLAPPETARRDNPYREWIGAQIRADAYGYVMAGDPEGAAALAHVDASLSHTANGVYGAMWAAALVAAAFAEPDMGAALRSALAVIPERSRLAEALRGVEALHGDGLDWEAARDVLEERHGHLSPVHAINNAALVAAALLWGEGDFTRTIGLAVQGGWDTDCNGATAGSAFGAMHCAGAIPDRWTLPLGDRVRSALFGFDGVRRSDLARRTVALLEHRLAAGAA